MNLVRSLCNVGLVVGLLLGSSWVVLAADDFEEGLVLYYPFEGSGDEMTDMSEENNHGALTDAIRTEDGEGLFGKGIEFPTFLDGTVIPDSESLLVTESGFTGTAWVYVTELNFGGNRENRVIFVHHQINIDLLLGKGRMDVHDGGWRQLGMGPEMPLEEWHMVTGTFSVEEGARLYRDGFEVKRDPSMNSVDENPGATYLGSMLGLEGYVGRMDEVRIWNRALSEDEVEALFSLEPSQAVSPKGKLATMWGTVKY